jgi:hypothetical protein
MDNYNLRIEGVNLSNFVYDTQDLSTIRGSGLAILEAVNLLEGKEISCNGKTIKLEKISAGASAGLFGFEADETFDEKNFTDTVRKYLINIKPVLRFATFVIDVVAVGDDFQTDREKLLAENRWRQMQSLRLTIPKFETDALDRSFKRVSCEVDSVRRADVKERFKGGEKEVSQSILERRTFGQNEKQQFIEREIKDYFDDTAKIEYNFAYDFDDLTFGNGKQDDHNLGKDKSNLHNKMAVIYLDGNDFGKKQSRLDREQLKQFDELKTHYQRKFLAALMKEVVEDKVGWHYTRKDEREQLETIYQLEILLWGGDEICLVVPAWKGWETLQLFYQETKELYFPDNDSPDKQKLTHSVGIVFCHHNAPIRRIKDLASKLADLAKQKSRRHNYFAYEILESFDHVSKDLAEHRKSHCPQIEPIEEKNLILDGDEMFEITKKMQALKGFLPRRKLTRIVLKLLSPIENDAEKTKRMEAVAKLIQSVEESAGEKKAELDEFINLLPNRYTAWIHALELWDYIEEAA